MGTPEVQESVTDSLPGGILSTSTSTTSNVCRICQSETGVMVRPCVCAGTMGSLHPTCLNEWVTRSQTRRCEICNVEYAVSSKHFKPLREWARPHANTKIWLTLVAILCLSFTLVRLVLISMEREFVHRVFVLGYPPRGADMGRVLLGVVILFMLYAMLRILFHCVSRYFERQRITSFVDNAAHAKS